MCWIGLGRHPTAQHLLPQSGIRSKSGIANPKKKTISGTKL
jgi:hypothetical protein